MKSSKIIFVICGIIAVVAIWRIGFYTPKSVSNNDKAKQPTTTTEKSAPKQSEAADESKDDKDGGKAETATDAKPDSDDATADHDVKANDDEGKERDGKNAGDKKSAGKDSPEDDDSLVAINLDNVEMKTIIQTLGDWTGKPIIPTNDEVMQQKLTIYAQGKMPKAKALSLIYDALRVKGFISEEVNDRIFLKPIAGAKFGSVPTLSFDEPLARLEDKSQIVEKFFKLNDYSAARMVQVVTPLIAEYGHVTGVETTGTLAVIDTVENLMRIERIIAQLDVPESEQVAERFFEIKNGDPSEIVQVLELILRQNKGGSYKSGGSGAKGGPGKGTATSVIIEASDVPATLIPIPKHNWIIVRASKTDMEKIAEWIERLDMKESVEPEQTIIKVEFVDVREVERLIRYAMSDMPGSKLETSVVVQAMPEAKQIVILGSAENRKAIEKLIAQIDLPTDDIFIEKTFKLKHADPDKIKENLEGLYESISGYSQSSRYSRGSYSSRRREVKPEDTVKVISYPTTSQVTVIAAEENMKKVTDQIAEWDKPLDIEKDQYRIIALRNSDPVKMVDLLSTLFSEEDSSSGRNFFSYFFGGGDDSKKKIVGSLYGMLTFEAVPDTKKIIVISKIPQAYDVIERLVKDLDSQEMAEVPKVITLKYAEAEDLCDQLNAILNESGTTATVRRKTRGLSVDSDTPEDEDGSKTNNNNDSGNQSAGEIKPWWDQQRRSTDEMPASNLIGKIRFIPVHRSKAILVLSPPEYLESIEAMIEELDQPGKQVMIKVAIVEVDHSRMTSLGLLLSTNPSALGEIGENAFAALTTLKNMATLGSVSIDTTLDITSLLDLLEKNVDAKILNQPTLWTKDNEEAVFIKAQNVAFIVAEQSDRTNINSTNQQFEYRNVGVTLRIRPNITPESAVDTTIYLEISTVESELINGQIATNKLDMTTNIIVDDGETVMLGGILFQTDATVHQKVPFLGDIPLIGGLFNHDRQVMRNSELLIFVTPYVIDGAQTKPATIEFLDDAHARMTDVTLEVNELLEALEEETQIDKSTEVPDGQDEISVLPEPAIADIQAD